MNILNPPIWMTTITACGEVVIENIYLTNFSHLTAVDSNDHSFFGRSALDENGFSHKKVSSSLKLGIWVTNNFV